MKSLVKGYEREKGLDTAALGSWKNDINISSNGSGKFVRSELENSGQVIFHGEKQATPPYFDARLALSSFQPVIPEAFPERFQLPDRSLVASRRVSCRLDDASFVSVTTIRRESDARWSVPERKVRMRFIFGERAPRKRLRRRSGKPTRSSFKIARMHSGLACPRQCLSLADLEK